MPGNRPATGAETELPNRLDYKQYYPWHWLRRNGEMLVQGVESSSLFERIKGAEPVLF
jgi:hypothetical protein